jgi:hypothetical protein
MTTNNINKFALTGYSAVIVFAMLFLIVNFSVLLNIPNEIKRLSKDYEPCATPEPIVITETKIVKSFFTRLTVNKEVEKYLISNSDYVYSYFDKITKDREVSYFILANALEEEVPINISLAVCSVETGFNINAIRDNGKGSTDLGLYQLNNNCHVEYTKQQLLDLKTNVQIAHKHFSENYKNYGDWLEAVMAYNRGGLADRLGSKYASAVLEEERRFDLIFNSEFNPPLDK